MRRSCLPSGAVKKSALCLMPQRTPGCHCQAFLWRRLPIQQALDLKVGDIDSKRIDHNIPKAKNSSRAGSCCLPSCWVAAGVWRWRKPRTALSRTMPDQPMVASGVRIASRSCASSWASLALNPTCFDTPSLHLLARPISHPASAPTPDLPPPLLYLLKNFSIPTRTILRVHIPEPHKEEQNGIGRTSA